MLSSPVQQLHRDKLKRQNVSVARAVANTGRKWWQIKTKRDVVVLLYFPVRQESYGLDRREPIQKSFNMMHGTFKLIWDGRVENLIERKLIILF